MVSCKFIYNSFHNWFLTSTINTKLKAKSLPLYFLIYCNTLFIKPKITIKKKFKRTLVILKSPFHYKLPKHHIQYSYFNIIIQFTVNKLFFKQIFKILNSGFIHNKTKKILIGQNYSYNIIL